MYNTKRLAVIGCGYWGPNLIRNFQVSSNCEIKVVCDVNEERLSHMQNLYPEIHREKNYDAIIRNKDIDAIAIATPANTHYEIAEKSLLAGKHTYIEKPITTCVSECNRLIELAETSNLTLMVGHTFIYSSPVNKIMEIVNSGEIGELLYFSSQRLNLGIFQKDINVIWDLAPHDISILLYIMGMFPVSVNCQGKSHLRPGIEDVTNMSLSFPNGGFALIHNSWIDPCKVRRITIVGSKKMILYDDNEPLDKIKIYDKRVEIPPHYDTFAEFHYSYHYGDTYSPYVQQVEPLKKQCQHFIDCIEKGTKPKTDGYNGLNVVTIIEAAQKSMNTGGSKILTNMVN